MADDSGEIVREAAESVAFSNVKVVGEGPAFYSNLAMGNSVSHQQSMQTILTAATGSIVKKLTEVDTLEAISVLKATSGNDLGQQLAGLIASISSAQQGVKSAGNTPPVTP